MVDINIVFVNLMMKDDIIRAIGSVLADVASDKYAVQITVTDNSNNKDGIKEALAAKFPKVKYFDNGGNIGFGAGNNVGFKATPSRYYFALNRDTIIPENTHVIARMIEFMDAHPRVGAIGPKLLNMDGTLQSSCYRFDLKSMLAKPLKQLQWDKKYRWVNRILRRLHMADFDHNSTRPVDWVLGAALVVRHEVAQEIGWFDERYLAYLEDCDWCHTMWEHGWPVYYVHDIIIKHTHIRASAKVPGVWRALVRNKTARIHLVSWCKYLWKWRGNHKYYAPIA